ncbi:MAG: hypothetical protein EPN45_19495 [Rhizobiaceae bacterium]|nr:MAG: hypothetical protein EPN45_19495 [Rhizobiaceae bacterium]
MNAAEAKARLNALNIAIATAVQFIDQERDTIDRFFEEKASMESIGPILDPTLFNSTERRETEDLLAPVYMAAREFVDTYNRQAALARDALAKVRS